MNKAWIFLMVILYTLSSERRYEILEGHNREEKFMRRTLPTIAGFYGWQISLALADVAQKEQCPNECVKCLINTSYVSCGCSLLCGLWLCNECRKEWKKHEK